MYLYSRVFMIIQTGSAQSAIVKFESQGLNKMQFGTRIGAESDYIAGIGRDLRLIEGDVEHWVLGGGV